MKKDYNKAETFEGISRYIEGELLSLAWSQARADWGFSVLHAQVHDSATGLLKGQTRALYRFSDGSELLFENGIYRALQK